MAVVRAQCPDCEDRVDAEVIHEDSFGEQELACLSCGTVWMRDTR